MDNTLQLQIRHKHVTAHEEELLHGFIHMSTCSHYNTTYKFALARFLLEYAKKIPNEEIQMMIELQQGKIIQYKEIAKKFFEYYFPLVYDHRLKQDKHTRFKVYATYNIQDVFGENHPGDYHKLPPEKTYDAIQKIKEDVFGNFIKKRSQVVPKFQKIKRLGSRSRLDRMFYDYNNDEYTITIKPHAMKFLNENYDLLRPVPILRWARYMEEANPDADILPFLNEQNIKISSNIEQTLIKYLNELIPSNLQTNALADYCKNIRTGQDKSLILISTNPKHISEMFEKTVKKPISIQTLEKHNVPVNIRKRSHIGIFGIYEEYNNLLKDIEEGDTILYFNDKQFHASTKILAKTQNKKITNNLWNTKYSNIDTILFLTKIEKINIKFDESIRLFSDTEKSQLLAEKIDSKKKRNILEKFGNIGNTIRNLNNFERIEDINMTHKIMPQKIRIGQEKFRKRVLCNFDSKCALCGLSDEDLLEAAHIIPVKTLEAMGEIDNGICLCSIHHKMFDRKYFAIGANYCVFITRKDVSEQCRAHLQYQKISKPKQQLNPTYLDRRLLDCSL